MCKMDIFDLNLKEFEEKVNELVENMTADELLEELIDNGLIIDEYEKSSYYDINIEIENTWVHKNKKNKFEKMKINKKMKSNLLEAA